MAVYTYNLLDFPNGKVNSDRLSQEIHASEITISLTSIDTNSSGVMISFKTDLSAGEKTILDAIVANHSGEDIIAPNPIIKAEILTEAVHWVESGQTTQALFAAESLILDISAGDVNVAKSFSWPYNISVKSATIYITEDMIGDELLVHEAPNTLIGYLTQPFSVGDTSIYVSDTVLENIRKAYYIGVYVPGDEGIEISQVLEIDLKEKCLKLRTPSAVSLPPGTYLAMCSKLIPNLLFTCTQKVEIGKTIPTASRLPANIPIRVYYKNNNGKAKKLSIFVEYLY